MEEKDRVAAVQAATDYLEKKKREKFPDRSDKVLLTSALFLIGVLLGIYIQMNIGG